MGGQGTIIKSTRAFEVMHGCEMQAHQNASAQRRRLRATLTAAGGHGAAAQRGPRLGLQHMLHILLLRLLPAWQQRLLQVGTAASVERGGKGAPAARQAGAEPPHDRLAASPIHARAQARAGAAVAQRRRLKAGVHAAWLHGTGGR